MTSEHRSVIYRVCSRWVGNNCTRALFECFASPLESVGLYFRLPLFRKTIAYCAVLYLCIVFLFLRQCGTQSSNNILYSVDDDRFSQEAALQLPLIDTSNTVHPLKPPLTETSNTVQPLKPPLTETSNAAQPLKSLFTDTSNTFQPNFQSILKEKNEWKIYDLNFNLKKIQSYEFFSRDYKILQNPVRTWINKKVSLCGGDFTGYGNNFAHLKDVIIDPSCSTGRTGGEDISEVYNQAEDSEFLKLRNGYFKMFCHEKPIYKFLLKSHLRKWNDVLSINIKDEKFDKNYTIISKFTIALQRYEYANLYHTIEDWYDTFLMLVVFKQNPNNLNILWVDGHPKGGLDAVWTVLFGDVIRAGQLKSPTLFKNLVWGQRQSISLMNNHNLPSIPYVEEFRTFFLQQYQKHDEKKLNCKRLSVLFVWRRDYVAHPRNPSGKVSRKILNENELLESVKVNFPNSEVKGIQLDNYTMSEQLNFITNTDILVGMHGAGLTMALFLPKHSGLIEFYPRYCTNRAHFKAIARWRNLHYLKWVNTNTKNEFPDHKTKIPSNVVIDLVKKMQENICTNRKTIKT